MFSNWVIQGWKEDCFSIDRLGYYSLLPESEWVLMWKWLEQTSWILWTLNFIPEADTKKIRAALVSLCFCENRAEIKKLSCSRRIKGNQIVLAAYGWLFIVHSQLLWRKSSCCWIKCQVSKLPVAIYYTVTWNCRCPCGKAFVLMWCILNMYCEC